MERSKLQGSFQSVKYHFHHQALLPQSLFTIF